MTASQQAAQTPSLWRQTAAMLNLGAPPPEALKRIGATSSGPEARLARTLAEAMERGSTLTEAVQKEGAPDIVLASIRVSENSGDLVHGLDNLATLLDGTLERTATWRTTMAYPQMLAVGLTVLVLVISRSLWLVHNMLATFTARDTTFGFQQPGWLSVTVASHVEQVLGSIWTWIVLGILLLLAHLLLTGRAGFDSVRTRVPVVGNWLVRVEMIGWLQWMDWFIENGRPLAESARIAAASCTSPAVRTLLERVADRLDSGTHLGAAFAAEPSLPPLIAWLLERAETAEFHNHLLASIADLIERDTESTRITFICTMERLSVLALGCGAALMATDMYAHFCVLFSRM